ncbi:MAG: TonB-dependent receptor [Ignavibacteriota bacterium]
MSNSIRKSLIVGSFALAMLTALPVTCMAQLAGSGTINGSVTDPTGASVPAAEITIRNVETGIERKTQTTGAGDYSAAFLPPGHYEVQTSKAGFTAVLRKDLVLQVGQTLTVNLGLTVQAAQQEVTVTGAAPVVDTEKTENSQVVSDSAVSNLPVAGRRWDTFVLLTPNVTTDGTSGLVSYRGISGLYNSNTVDGANNNQALFSEARGRALSGAYVYSLDSIREYQVTASNYSAELGQAAGGVVNAVTKSGANAFHGDLFYYLRYPTWAALDPFPKSQKIYSQPIHQWQQFGGSGGGPIIKDKLFFFVTYDGSRKVNPVTYTSTTNAQTQLTCPTQLTPTQCGGALNFLTGLTGTYPRATNQDVAFGKLDYQITQRHHLSTSFDWMNYRAPNAYSTSPSYNNDSIQTNGSYFYHERIFVANLDSTITPTMVNNVRFQWGRDLEVAGANSPAPYVSLSNITNYGEFYALPRTAEPDEHRTQIADTVSKIHGHHSFKAGFDFNRIHEVMINLFQGTGRYTYSGTAQQAFTNWALDTFGVNAGDGETGKHFNTFTQVNDPITHVGKDDFFNDDFSAFFEDSWKATSKLTLNLGLRYDIFMIPQPPQPNTSTPLETLYTSTIHVPKDQFAPRVGIAWEISPKTVLRTGYGLFFAKTTNTTYYNTRVENGVFQQTFNCTGLTTSPTCPQLSFPNVIWTPPGGPLAAPFAGALTPQVTTFAPPALSQASRGQVPDWENPRVHEGDVTLERELPGGISASAAYVVSRAERLPIFVDANLAPATTTKSYDILTTSGSVSQTYTVPFYTARTDTGTGIIQVGYSDVNSWYNSMVLSARRPFRHNLEFTANYTLSKAMDGGQISGSNGTFAGSDNPVDPKNRKPEWAASELDQRHRFVFNGVWAPTINSISSKAVKLIANGWSFSTIVTLGSGHPQQANISGTPSPLDGGLTAGVANNASANAGRAGWLPRDPYVAPGFHNVDFRLARQFSISERMKLTLLGEVFNIFNTTNVATVNTTAFTYLASGGTTSYNGATLRCPGPNACMAPSAPFMQTTGTSSLLFGPRQIQISGKITF